MKVKNVKLKLKSILTAFVAGTFMVSSVPVLTQVDVSAADTCIIDASTQYQLIRGFGGINHPEWTGQDMTEAQRKTAFGNGDNAAVLNSVELVNENFKWTDLIIQFFVVGGAYLLGPDVVSRNLLAKDGKTAKRASLISGIILFVFSCYYLFYTNRAVVSCYLSQFILNSRIVGIE